MAKKKKARKKGSKKTKRKRPQRRKPALTNRQVLLAVIHVQQRMTSLVAEVQKDLIAIMEKQMGYPEMQRTIVFRHPKSEEQS
jgi:hypothetical protein